MGLFNRRKKEDDPKVQTPEQDYEISEDDGSEKSEFITMVEECQKKIIQAVKDDEEARKAVIVIAVEEKKDGKGAHVSIQCGGAEENLIYALISFAQRKGTGTLLNMALNFIAHEQLKKQFTDDFKK